MNESKGKSRGTGRGTTDGPKTAGEIQEATTEFVSVGKMPGPVTDVPFEKGLTVGALFERAEISNLAKCEIQRNGAPAELTDAVEPGDQVFAVARIRGND